MRVRGAIIGCGYFSQHHLAAWRRIPEVEIIAACDLEYDRARRFADRAYCSAEEMLRQETLDFVDIATRVDSHLALASLAAQRGIAVICQKPIAPDWAAALRLVETMENVGVPFMVHEMALAAVVSGGERDDPARRYRSANRIRISNAHVRWRRRAAIPQQTYMRGLRRFLIDEALVHHFDTARFLFGDICSIDANVGRLNPEIAGEDRAIVIVNHGQGISGWVDGRRFLNPNPDGPAMGEALIEGDAGVLLILSTGDVYRDNVLAWKNNVTAGYRGDSVYATLAHFVRALIEKTEFETGGRDYLKTFAAVEAAYRSALDQRMVFLAEVTNPSCSPPPSSAD